MSGDELDIHDDGGHVTMRDLMREMKAVRSEQREMKQLIQGGSEPGRGIIVRLDRAEQTLARQKWWAATAIAALIGMAGHWFSALLKAKTGG